MYKICEIKGTSIIIELFAEKYTKQNNGLWFIPVIVDLKCGAFSARKKVNFELIYIEEFYKHLKQLHQHLIKTARLDNLDRDIIILIEGENNENLSLKCNISDGDIYQNKLMIEEKIISNSIPTTISQIEDFIIEIKAYNDRL